MFQANNAKTASDELAKLADRKKWQQQCQTPASASVISIWSSGTLAMPTYLGDAQIRNTAKD